jgi:PAS domain S-box-containing protein
MCDGLSVIDAGFVIRDANEAFVRHYGGDRDRIIGRTCHEVTHGSPIPCQGSEHDCPVLRARRTGAAASVEHLHRSETGREIIVEVTAIPVPEQVGERGLVVEVAHDITDRRRAEREAAERERIEGVLAVAGAACHHLNQPIQSLLLGIEQLRRKGAPLGPLDGIVGMLQQETERVAQITRQLQQVARCVTVPYYGSARVLDLSRSAADGEPAPSEAGGATAGGATAGSATSAAEPPSTDEGGHEPDPG